MRMEPNGDVRIEIPTQPGRTQVVNVTMGKDGDQDVAGFVWSKAGELKAAVDPWTLLKLNSSLTYGKVAVRGTDIVIVHGLFDGGADLAEVGKAIYWVARAADDLERTVYGAQTDVL
jgi:hypothetical protein